MDISNTHFFLIGSDFVKKISLLGATGSIGIQTLSVIEAHPDEFELVSMSFGRNIKSGIEIIRKFNPRFVAVQDKETYEKLKLELEIDKIKIGYGQEALIEAAIFDDVDCLVNAVVGSVGTCSNVKSN